MDITSAIAPAPPRALRRSAARGRRRLVSLAAVAGVAGFAAALIAPSTAFAATATSTVTAATLGFVSAPGDITFPSVTLGGANHTVTATLPLDVGDNTGSGVGWNITATSTTFTGPTPTSGTAPTLPATATTVETAPTDTCDSNVTCTFASNAITYSYGLPAGATAPTATKLFNAAANTGMADQTVTPTFTLAVPANSYAASYTSTWTISLVSGP